MNVYVWTSWELKNAYIWEVKWWAPSSSTIAYYKFDSNLNDSSGNWHNLSLYTWSVTYWTTSGWWKYAHFNQNTWANYLTYSGFNYDGQNTISLWFNPQGTFSSSQYAIAEMRETSTYAFYRLWWTLKCAYGIAAGGDLAYSVSTNNRYNIIYTRNWTSAKWYVNWVLIGSWTPGYSWRTNQTIRFRVNQVADTNSSTYANNGYYSELIREWKEWAAQEISDYYEATKDNYQGGGNS